MTRHGVGCRLRDLDRRGATLDVWFRWVGWGDYGESAPEETDAALAGGDRSDAGAAGRGPPDPLDDRRRRAAFVGRRRVPPPAPAVAPVGRPQHDQPRRHLRAAQQRGVDRARTGRRRRPARGVVRPAGGRGGARRPRRRQVPADARLRRAERGAHRRRLTGAPRRPPRRGNHRDARGLLQLQRRHARCVDGGGADLARASWSATTVDVGGGASIMGTLSGGGTEQVSIGERCLLGANSGLGISLGDDCVVEAGLYVTAGTLVKLPDGAVVKARELSGVGGPAVPPPQPDGRGRGDPCAAAPAGPDSTTSSTPTDSPSLIGVSNRVRCGASRRGVAQPSDGASCSVSAASWRTRSAAR